MKIIDVIVLICLGVGLFYLNLHLIYAITIVAGVFIGMWMVTDSFQKSLENLLHLAFGYSAAKSPILVGIFALSVLLTAILFAIIQVVKDIQDKRKRR